MHWRNRGLLLVLTGFVAMLLVLQTELRVDVYGELVPAERNFVFAPDDGTVGEIFVSEGSVVAADDVLCILRNEDFILQLEAIEGELAAANARLAAIDAVRGGQRAGSEDPRLWSAEQAELLEEIASLEKQTGILQARIDQLRVMARIPGRVYGDRLRQTLFRRPVRRGQYLFEVADPTAAWQLHLRVPEADVRYVQEAEEEPGQRPGITFALETSPDTTRRTVLQTLGLSTDVDAQGRLTTLAIADLAGSEFTEERPGAGVVARIDCGRRSAGFVWFRRVIEFVQRHTWL